MAFLDQFKLFSQCKKYNLSLWQCPPFLFVIIGIVIIIAILLTYFIGIRYFGPREIILIALGATTILWILNYIIVHTFEKLAEANLMKSEFIRIISHQLRTPLSNLKWILELAIKEEDRSRIQEYFEMIRENNNRMIKLIEDMIYASKIEQGKWISRREETSLRVILDKVMADFSFLLKKSGIKVKVNIEKNLPKVLVNSREINEVISKLLDNAIHYSKEGGLIEIKLIKRNERIRCEVKDNGAGIPKEEQKYIFQKFFRSGNALKYQTEGMGLGLFIVKGIIERLGGRVGFKSKEGKGSNFWFELPITSK